MNKDCIETAYAFLHQKRNVYIHSSLEWQKDDIEYAIATYVDSMNGELYEAISGGQADFLRDHRRFREDITLAVERLEKVMELREQSGACTGSAKPRQKSTKTQMLEVSEVQGCESTSETPNIKDA